MGGYIPKSSGGALVMAVISIGIMIGCFALAYHGWIGPWIAHRDWVEVDVSQQDRDCRMEWCYNKGGRYSCEKCTIDYKYVYNGKTYGGTKYYKPPSEGKTKKALIDPNNPKVPVDSPSVGLFILEMVVCLFGLGFVLMFISLFRSYKDLEDLGREDMIEKLAAGESAEQIVAEELEKQDALKKQNAERENVKVPRNEAHKENKG